MNYKARRAGSIALGFASAAGTIATAIMVAKETPKALSKIKELKSSNKPIKKIDYLKTLLPVYWPAVVICAGTIASTTISNIISMKTEASLIATSTLLSQGFNKYKGKVKDIFGIDADKLIKTDMSVDDFNKNLPDNLSKKTNYYDSSKGEMLYWEEHLGFFTCSEKKLANALSDLNQRLHTPDANPKGTFYWTTLYFLMKDAGARVFDKNKLEACKAIGWTTDYLCEVFDLHGMWVHPLLSNIAKKEDGEVLYTKLSFLEDPIFLEDSERSRGHYKSRNDYEHEAEVDMHDTSAFELVEHDITDIQSAFINSKVDCDRVVDDGVRFVSSNNPSGQTFIEDNPELPSEKDIPNVGRKE